MNLRQIYVTCNFSIKNTVSMSLKQRQTKIVCQMIWVLVSLNRNWLADLTLRSTYKKVVCVKDSFAAIHGVTQMEFCQSKSTVSQSKIHRSIFYIFGIFNALKYE